MATRKKPVPITVDAGQCLSLLTNVARAAFTDNYLPMLNGVLLHGDVHDGKPVLVATATDRFIMVQASVDATGDPLPEVLVPLAEVKRVAVVLRSLPKATTLLEVSAPRDGSAVFAARNASVTTEPAAENGAGQRAEEKAARRAEVEAELAAKAAAAEAEKPKPVRKPAARKAPVRTSAAKPAPRRTSRAKAAA